MKGCSDEKQGVRHRLIGRECNYCSFKSEQKQSKKKNKQTNNSKPKRARISCRNTVCSLKRDRKKRSRRQEHDAQGLPGFSRRGCNGSRLQTGYAAAAAPASSAAPCRTERRTRASLSARLGSLGSPHPPPPHASSRLCNTRLQPACFRRGHHPFHGAPTEPVGRGRRRLEIAVRNSPTSEALGIVAASTQNPNTRRVLLGVKGPGSECL